MPRFRGKGIHYTARARFRLRRGRKGERADKKRDFKAGVKREENGDVYISGVPMVDQGDKGYCATATVERCLKYYGIENVDMHKIAELCGTGAAAARRRAPCFPA